MSDTQEKAINEIILDAHNAIKEASEAKRAFWGLSKILIGLMFMAVSAVSILIWQNKKQSDDIQFLSKDYAPLWIIPEMQENYDYAIKQIAATFGATKEDEAKIDEILKKYSNFQLFVINKIASMRGGMTNITRSLEPEDKGGSQ